LIDIAPGAESSPLAASLAELVRRNIARDKAARAEFDRLRGAVAIVADDEGAALTLRFDFGRLVVHTGVVGVPDLTLRGPIDALARLGELRAGGLVGFVRASDLGTLKLYGLRTHPLMVRRLLRVLSEG
jgi:hypothetical protein